MKSMIKKSILISLFFLVLCGIIYPLGMTAVSQVIFNNKANGSIVKFDGKEIGSKLIGQSFDDAKFFKGRVSDINYNTSDKKSTSVSSGSDNLSPSSDKLKKRVQEDVDSFLKNHPDLKKEDIPEDLVTSSASGLDPDISPKAAEIQVASVSKASGIDEDKLRGIIKKYTTGKALGIFGEKRVNVLLVNLEIADELKRQGKF